MENTTNIGEPKAQKMRHFHYPLTPYQLFSPVSSVFLNNLTQEEQILGLYKHFNIMVENLNLLVEDISGFDQDIAEVKEAVTTLQTYLTQKLIDLTNQIIEGDQNTLNAANTYTDNEIQKIPDNNLAFNPLSGKLETVTTIVNDLYNLHRTDALTAEEYDNLELTAEAYDQKELTAYGYDLFGKTLIMGVTTNV